MLVERIALGGRVSRRAVYNQEGFSLIEVLVTIAIVALCASAVGRVASTRTSRLAHDTDRLRAVLAAEAILNRVGLD